jgi:regulator of sirC expression with transglutaminase-like and TPR domain
MNSGRLFTHPAVARQRFRQLAQLPDAALDLTEASLVIAQETYPGIDVRTYVKQLDHWSEEIRSRLAGSRDVERVVEEINHLLFELEGFHGEGDDYYDLRNTFLNEVLDRHAGLPLALSIVYIELSRRLGLDSSGVSLPGRFLVKVSGRWGDVLIDPFDGGRVLSTLECQRIMDQVYGGGVRLREHHLRAIPNRGILVRLLAHLKASYLARHDVESAIHAIDRLLILDERDVEELRDRGALAMQLHRYTEAIEHLERYLALASEGDDVLLVREQVLYLRSWLEQN